MYVNPEEIKQFFLQWWCKFSMHVESVRLILLCSCTIALARQRSLQWPVFAKSRLPFKNSLVYVYLLPVLIFFIDRFLTKTSPMTNLECVYSIAMICDFIHVFFFLSKIFHPWRPETLKSSFLNIFPSVCSLSKAQIKSEQSLRNTSSTNPQSREVFWRRSADL